MRVGWPPRLFARREDRFCFGSASSVILLTKSDRSFTIGKLLYNMMAFLPGEDGTPWN